MPFVKRNAEAEEKRVIDILTESEDSRAAFAEYQAQYEFRKAMIQARKSENISQKQLSEMTGLTQQVISRIETGNTNATLETILKYLNGIGYGLSIRRLNQ